jgi:hypothetical protein
VTTLLVETLNRELIQEIQYDLNERVHIAAFIPYLYIHNAAFDSITFELFNSGGDVLFSKETTLSEIKESIPTTDNYIHVFYPIIPTNPVQLEYGTYRLRMTATNYYPVSSSFIGWIKQFEDIQNEISYPVSGSNNNPLAIRYKLYKEGLRG